MSTNFASIEMKKQRGKLVLNGLGRTATGQKYIKGQQDVGAESPADPNFKSDLSAAVAKLTA